MFLFRYPNIRVSERTVKLKWENKMNLILLQLTSLTSSLQIAFMNTTHIDELCINEELMDLLNRIELLSAKCEQDKDNEILKVEALDLYLEGCDVLVGLRRRCIEFYNEMYQNALSIYTFYDADPDIKGFYPKYNWEDPKNVLDIFSAVKEVMVHLGHLESVYCLRQVYNVIAGEFDSSREYHEMLAYQNSLPVEMRISTKIANAVKLSSVKKKDIH